MKQIYALIALLLATALMLIAMAAMPSNGPTTSEASTPTRYWLKSPTGVAYFEECISEVVYMGTSSDFKHPEQIVFAYSGKVCDNDVLDEERL